VPKVVRIDDLDDALTINDVAKMMKRHRTTVEKMVREGTLAATRVGAGRGQWVITRRDVTDYLNRNHHRAG
jgi:excisionase family DNA binding protein